MNIKTNTLYTPKEVGEYLKIGYRNMLLLIHKKKIKSIKIGNLYRIPGIEINNYIKRNYLY